MGNVAFLGECGHVDLWTFGNAERPQVQPLKAAVGVLWKRWGYGPHFTHKSHPRAFLTAFGAMPTTFTSPCQPRCLSFSFSRQREERSEATGAVQRVKF